MVVDVGTVVSVHLCAVAVPAPAPAPRPRPAPDAVVEADGDSPVLDEDRDAAFTAFAKSARRDLSRAAWAMTRDTHQAGELVQLALVRTYLAWPRACATDPTAYARRVLSNARIDLWRRRRRETLTPPEELPEASVLGEHAAVEDRDEVRRALAGLSEQQRRVVVLRYLSGLSEREVAEHLGVTVGTVKTQTSRALRRLRAVLCPTELEPSAARTA